MSEIPQDEDALLSVLDYLVEYGGCVDQSQALRCLEVQSHPEFIARVQRLHLRLAQMSPSAAAEVTNQLIDVLAEASTHTGDG